MITIENSTNHGADSFALCPRVLDREQVQELNGLIERRYQEVAAANRQGGLAAVSELIGAGQRFAPTASSLTLGAVLSEQELNSLLAVILTGPAGGWICNALGDRPTCDLDQAWVRRQYAPRNYPPWHAPHGWHQDGALGFDFLSRPEGPFPADALLHMITCWIALTPCGVNAPGLELVTRRPERMFAPAELAEPHVRGCFAASEFWRPQLTAGDALLFHGNLLHRTFVTPQMEQDRTSLELRFFPANNLPPRLQGDRMLSSEATGRMGFDANLQIPRTAGAEESDRM